MNGILKHFPDERSKPNASLVLKKLGGLMDDDSNDIAPRIIVRFTHCDISKLIVR